MASRRLRRGRRLFRPLRISDASLIWGLEFDSFGPLTQLLSWRPLVWIGQISYGLYLWHWPVIVGIRTGFRQLDVLPGSTGLNLTRVALTFGVATASFYLVEQPVKQGRIWLVGRSRLRLAAATAGVTALVAGTVVATTRIDIRPVEDIPGCPSGTYRPCVRVQGPHTAPVVAVIGDSLARSLDPAFAELARQNGWTYILGATNGCRITHLLTSSPGLSKAVDQQCYDQTPQLQRLVLASHPSVIVAVDRWEIMDFMAADGRIVRRGRPEHLAVTERAMTDTAVRLTSGGAQVVFIGLPPILSTDCGRPGTASSSVCRVSASSDAEQAPYNAILQRIGAAVPKVSMISITDAVCPHDLCTWEVGNVVPRSDGLHFTPAGNAMVAPILFHNLRADGLLPE